MSLKTCVVYDGEVYCWDSKRGRDVKVLVEVIEGAPVHEGAQKQIAMKRFGGGAMPGRGVNSTRTV